MKPVIIAVIIVILVVAIGALLVAPEKETVSDIDEPIINNFEECIAAGNPAMESYPRQCRTPDGKHFVESIPEQEEATPTSTTIEQKELTSSTKENCDSSYPDVCIASYPPDLDCDEISYSNFRVVGDDPHGFDTDFDGIGCEVGSPQSSNPVESTPSCDESYPDVCIPPYPPDLDCGEIGYSNFKVVGDDPHGFDRDNDGIGCES